MKCLKEPLKEQWTSSIPGWGESNTNRVTVENHIICLSTILPRRKAYRSMLLDPPRCLTMDYSRSIREITLHQLKSRQQSARRMANMKAVI
ncbi:hypothetical protein AOLI_G00065880 [Acnodon oligacanthus]